jgi:precorrin-6B methylase 2
MRSTRTTPAAHAAPTERAPSSRSEVLVVSSIHVYRRLARELPTLHDAVLEIGCSTGGTTRLPAERAGRVLAVDVAAELVDPLRVALAPFRGVSVVHLDARHTADLAALMPEPNLIFIDVGGNAQLDNVALQVRQCLRTFSPRLLVVRSTELAALCARITVIEAGEAPGLCRQTSRDDSSRALGSLLDLSRSPNVKNRIFAARRLRGCASPTARERLRQMAADPDPRVRRIATRDRAEEARTHD